MEFYESLTIWHALSVVGYLHILSIVKETKRLADARWEYTSRK